MKSTFNVFVVIFIIIMATSSKGSSPKVDVVVAQDGSGNFKTITAAVTASPDHSKERFSIYIKGGVYKEIVHIPQQKTNLAFLGEGSGLTVITGNLNHADGVKTYQSATLAVDGNGFMARDIRIENTAGPSKGQAVALRVSGDRAVLYRCHISGYQDTLYAHKSRQFYRECFITGTVDFICGAGAAVFQYCTIEARKPNKGQENMISAQQRDDLKLEPSGFAFHKCNITASADLLPVKNSVKTYLGRPWGNLSTVAVLESVIGDHVDPEGWCYWENANEPRLKTLTYREFRNNGPGSETRNRVKWPGFRVIKHAREAQEFTVGGLLQGDLWINATGVPYEAGL